MLDDPNKLDPRAQVRTALFAMVSDVVAPNPTYLRATGDNMLTVAAGITVAVGTSVFSTALTNLGAGNLDTGASFAIGMNYYVYICDPGGSGDEIYLISLNATSPQGYNATNSRRIGGFHVGMCRRVDSMMRPINAGGVAWDTGWEANVYLGIVPASVWTLKHRPKCAPEGMVYIGSSVWADIYLNSSDGADGLQSVYNAIPLTGTEGHNWYSFNDRALAVEKRLMTYAEFCKMAYGSPQGNAADNLNAWSATTNTGRNPTGLVDRAVSAVGAREAVANCWEWLDESITNASGYTLNGTTAPTSYTYPWWDGGRGGLVNTTGTNHGPTTRTSGNTPNSTQGQWNWDPDTPLGDTTDGNPDNGNIFQYFDWSLVALLAGGDWGNGARAGSRAVSCNRGPWDVGTGIGVRLACESL